MEQFLGSTPKTESGGRLKWLPVLDEFTRECLSLEVERSMTSGDVLETLELLVAQRGAPEFIRSDNINEIVAAMEVSSKKVDPAILEFAKMMHTEHGKNVADTMALGQKMDITPLDTAKTDDLRKKGAAELADLLEKDEASFGAAYVDAMVKGHNEVLAMIDDEFIKNAKNESLKKHLATTREHVAMHLEHAKKLQGNASEALNANSCNLTTTIKTPGAACAPGEVDCFPRRQ